MSRVEEILHALQQDTWDPVAVDAAIAAKVEKRAAKGQDLNMYSLDLAPRNMEERWNREDLDNFINNIHQKALSTDKPIRIQLAVRTSNVHWTAMDLEIASDFVKIINVDAAEDPSSFVISELYKGLLKKYEDPNQSRFYFLRHGVIPGEVTKSQAIQYDSSSCSCFALDALFHLSNLDSFSLLEAQDTRLENTSHAFRTFSSAPTERFFQASNMPVEFAVLYKNTQSKLSFNSLPSTLRNHIVNKKGQSLQELERKHTHQVEIRGRLKYRNQAIQGKRLGYQEDTSRFLTEHPDDFNEKIQRRNILVAILSPDFPVQTVIDQRRVALALIEEAVNIEASQSYWGLSRLYNRIMNKGILDNAHQALTEGRPQDALEYLETMRDITLNHKSQLAAIREKCSEEEDHSHVMTSK